jgi:hypothetical protein
MIQNKYKSIRQIIFLGLIICIFSLFIVSCQTKEQPINSTNKQQNERFLVRFVQAIEDTEAPFDRRKIYIIKDKVTKKEYIGITGVGISEITDSMRNRQNE